MDGGHGGKVPRRLLGHLNDSDLVDSRPVINAQTFPWCDDAVAPLRVKPRASSSLETNRGGDREVVAGILGALVPCDDFGSPCPQPPTE